MAIVFPGEMFPAQKPDLETIESFDNSQIGGVEKFSTISTGVISIDDVIPESGGTFSGDVAFQSTETQGNNFISPINVASATINWVRVSKSGAQLTDIVASQAHETNAKVDYTTGDLDSEAEIISAINATNTKLNSIITKLENLKLLATS